MPGGGAFSAGCPAGPSEGGNIVAMKTQKIGAGKLTTTRLAYGCMRIVGTWDPKSIGPEQRKMASRAVHAAVDAGYTLFDHADIYCAGGCESVFGEILKA